MRILFTGASSFTGMWFVRELALNGHQITATFQHSSSSYEGMRKKRIEQILDHCQPVYECPFGSEHFLKLLENNPHWDLFCHHAADVTNYKSPDFDFSEALRKNTYNLKEVITHLKCKKILLTGSVFEQGEGFGSDNLPAVSPYGLSKGLTSDVFRYFCHINGLQLGKFVIPNPFGPFEEMRFTSYLAQNWLKGVEPVINTPDYIRDNIPIPLLAKSYAKFATSLDHYPEFAKINPSYQPETQGQFTSRFADEMRKRFSMPCLFTTKKQTEFNEPKIRVNTDTIRETWNETAFWDDLAEYYLTNFQIAAAT